MAGISRAASNAAAAEEAARQEALKKRAARTAATKLTAPPEPAEVVECTVLPMGADKISMGVHIGSLGEAHYEEGEAFTVELPIAVALFDRGFVNFPGGSEASAAARKAQARQRAVERAEAAELQAMLDS